MLYIITDSDLRSYTDEMSDAFQLDIECVSPSDFDISTLCPNDIVVNFFDSEPINLDLEQFGGYYPISLKYVAITPICECIAHNNFSADEVSEVRRVEILPNSLVDEEQASIGVVHEVVNVVGLKLMENRHRNSSESESTKHGDSPLRRVAATKGNLVARFHAGFLKKNVDFCYLSGNILILITDTLEISKGKFFPILSN